MADEKKPEEKKGGLFGRFFGGKPAAPAREAETELPPAPDEFVPAEEPVIE